MMCAIASEGRYFVISAYQYFTRGDDQKDYFPIQSEEPGAMLEPGKD